MLSRGSGEEILDLHWSGAQRNDSYLSLAFIDLDHFKAINDNYGHEAGDRTLCAFAALLQNDLRDADSLLRWGGEEFLLVMPNTDAAQAGQALQRLMQRGLGSRPDGLPLTASIGLAERRHDQAASCRELLELADRRMYLAKNRGRNQIYGHNSLAPQQA
ncbi:putative diguanylate cyclase YedQ [compost metagenome]